eukprot:6479155-Amphidinium_carterae.2
MTDADAKQLTMQKLDAMTQLHSFYELMEILVEGKATDNKPQFHGPSLLTKRDDVQRLLVDAKKVQSIVESGTNHAEHSQKFKDWITSPGTAERFKAMLQHTKAVKKEVSQACSEILVKATAELSELAGCSRGGQSWKADVAADARLADIVPVAGPALQGAVAVELNASFNRIQKEQLQIQHTHTYRITSVVSN